MFEYHGWISVRYHPYNIEQTSQELCWKNVTDLLQKQSFPLAQAVWHNGLDTIHFGGCHNHLNPKVLEFFALVGEFAPGAYGVLHIHDDEAPRYGNIMQKFILKRSVVSSQTEGGLTPFIPAVEDAYDASRET